MKKLLVLWVALAAMCFTGCSKDDDDNDDDNREGVITMVTEAKYVDFCIASFKEGETITIDWGDGLIEEVVTLADYDDDEGFLGYDFEAKHSYAKYKPHTIIIKGNIKGLYCSDNNLSTLDVSRCTALTELYCADNNLSTLDVSRCTALTELTCWNNNLTTLDVSKNTALTKLICCENNLTTLDVSKNTALTWLECCENNLTTLDVSKNTALTRLECTVNNLTTLDVNKNTALTKLLCENNNLSASALNQIFNDLPQVSDGHIQVYNNPGSKTCNKSIAENKGWRVVR